MPRFVNMACHPWRQRIIRARPHPRHRALPGNFHQRPVDDGAQVAGRLTGPIELHRRRGVIRRRFGVPGGSGQARRRRRHQCQSTGSRRRTDRRRGRIGHGATPVAESPIAANAQGLLESAADGRPQTAQQAAPDRHRARSRHRRPRCRADAGLCGRGLRPRTGACVCSCRSLSASRARR